jgi:hypothetical protein
MENAKYLHEVIQMIGIKKLPNIKHSVKRELDGYQRV